MFNLTNDEIVMVDGGGDGNSNGNTYGGQLTNIGVGLLVSRVHPALGIAYSVGTMQGSYGNNSGVHTGTNQNYGRYGLDSGGGMMQAGGSRGGWGY
ncbi:hypothetical protein [Vibrio parahaemolyticus]|uniref:hypothetical protein n=1 Tax=Vibrio parahaemolyticus TaxID=670 RepID=UPI0038928C5D